MSMSSFHNFANSNNTLGLFQQTRNLYKRPHSFTSTQTRKKQKTMKSEFTIQAGRTKFKHRKPKVINSWPKGLSRKFEKKVKKALAVNDLWGKYIYTSRVRLRQVNQDKYSCFTADENSNILDFGTVAQYRDASDILFNNKAATSVWTTAGGSEDTVKLEVVKSSAEMFFKSSSGHVVNIECYECTPKMCQSDRIALTEVTQSYQAMVSAYYQGPADPPVIMAPEVLNSAPEDWVQLYQKWHVKKHVVKLLPGQSTSLYFKGLSNKTIDLSKLQQSGTVVTWAPQCNSKNFFFRVINDISVSKVTGSVYHYPSNNSGGVAVEFKRTYTLRPPPGGVDDVATTNKIVNGLWRVAPGASEDQQITYENPVASASTDI